MSKYAAAILEKAIARTSVAASSKDSLFTDRPFKYPYWVRDIPSALLSSGVSSITLSSDSHLKPGLVYLFCLQHK